MNETQLAARGVAKGLKWKRRREMEKAKREIKGWNGVKGNDTSELGGEQKV